MKYKLYEVGGKIRDEALGLTSKDVDYSVVFSDYKHQPIEEVFDIFVSNIKSKGFEVFVETPECFTVRAMFPKDHQYSGVADFVLARKELYYPDRGRKPISVLGTLHDDLERRDFTVNAMAKGEDGVIIDPFDGHDDLALGILRTPKDAILSFNNDPLRILRAMRFAITKNFNFSDDINHAISMFDSSKMEVVSEERIREELHKMFKHDTLATLAYIMWLEKTNFELFYTIFDNNIWLMPTTKE